MPRTCRRQRAAPPRNQPPRRRYPHTEIWSDTIV
jgi:hypothetical protein